MRKVFFAVVVLMLTAAAAHAQSTFGLKAGANYSTIGGADLSDMEKGLESELDYSVGYHAGGMINIFASERIAIQPELLFSVQGAAFSADDNVKWHVSYISVLVKI